ncbi:hypothetical protein VP1G_02470 [Cytospora mali]|uniref:N-acetyltransferase domain-containing protein n=1 Tax=Cytospora mali TaxID=578113 RepID=A0A194UTW0_CYTMA|nr:hypothetical protein VP1G_02470 [Valsa mali var. pyri (nom. inval.)]
MATVTSNTVTIVGLEHSLVPKQWGETVRIVGMSEYQQVALSLAHAFAADDLAFYLLNSDDMSDLSPEEKWKLHVDIFQYIVAAHCLNGEVHVIGPDHEGVALWMPPGKNIDDWWTVLRSGMWRLYFQLSSEGRKRYYDEMLPLLHHTKAEILGDRDDNAYYLADAENRPVYLESSSLANNAYYAKWGFVVKKEIFLKRGPVPVQLTIMVREPRPVPKLTNLPAMATLKSRVAAVAKMA